MVSHRSLACEAWRHPLPDIETWAAVRDPDERLHLALSELYAYYEGAEAMLSNILRDLELRGRRAPAIRDVPRLHGRRARDAAGGPRLAKGQATVGRAMSFGRPEPRAD